MKNHEVLVFDYLFPQIRVQDWRHLNNRANVCNTDAFCKIDEFLLDLWNRIREKCQSITKVSYPGRHDKKEEKFFFQRLFYTLNFF